MAQKTNKKITWKSVTKKLTELKPYEHNPRDITEKGLADLKKSIDKFGIAEPIVINTDGTICGGHARYFALKEQGIKQVDCYIPNRKLNKKEMDELNIRLNKNIAGKWDFDILANDFQLDDLLEWGFEESELDINLWKPEIEEDKLDEVPEPQKEAISKLGDLFVLDGKHRILCGDSTKKEDVEKLMDGKKADMVFTDPPYGINYEHDNRPAKRPHKFDKLKNDDLGLEELLPKAFGLMSANIKNGAVYYCWHSGKTQREFQSFLEKAGFLISTTIIWVKGHFSFSRQDYHPRHEPCFYGWKTGAKHQFYGERNQSTVWNELYDSGNVTAGHNTLHPTQKPMKLGVKAIKNSSKSEDIILDLFLGSGSTLIAAEQTNRICCGMELDPIYIDVILRRYKNLYPESEIKCLNRNFNFEKLYNI